MTSLAARGRLRGTAIVVAAAGLAAGLAAAAMVVPLEVVVVGLIAVSGAIAVIASPQVGLVAIAVFTVLRIPEVATEFHGAPSLFLPLLALVALSLLLRRGEIAGASGGVNAAMAVAAFLAVAAISLLAASDAIDTVGTLRGVAEDGSVAVLAGILLRGTGSLRRLVWAVVLAGGAIGAVATLQFILGAFDTTLGGFAQSAVQQIVETTDAVRISGPVGDPNYFAQWMVMIIPLAVDRFSDETRRGLRACSRERAGHDHGRRVHLLSRRGARPRGDWPVPLDAESPSRPHGGGARFFSRRPDFPGAGEVFRSSRRTE